MAVGRPKAPLVLNDTDEQVEDVVIRTLESKPKNATHWSTRGMARATGAVIGKCFRRHRHQEFLKFVKEVDAALPEEEGVEVHIVMTISSALHSLHNSQNSARESS